MKKRFILDTSTEIFLRWLEDYATSEEGYLVSLLRRGRSLWQVEVQYPVARPIRIGVDPSGIWSLMEKDIPGHWLGMLISFRLVPLARERVEVIAECHASWKRDRFKELLSRIAKRWPEAAEAISQWFEPKPEEAVEETVERQKPAEKTVRPHIKQRRMKVMNLSKRGLTVSDIAKRVYCSERTVKRDRRALRKEGLL